MDRIIMFWQILQVRRKETLLILDPLLNIPFKESKTGIWDADILKHELKNQVKNDNCVLMVSTTITEF